VAVAWHPDGHCAQARVGAGLGWLGDLMSPDACHPIFLFPCCTFYTIHQAFLCSLTIEPYCIYNVNSHSNGFLY
jgi:hypothetical protein